METKTIVIIWSVATFALFAFTCGYAIYKIRKLEKAFPFKTPAKLKVPKHQGTTPPMSAASVLKTDPEVQL